MTDEPQDKRVPQPPRTQGSAKAIRSVTKAGVGSIPGLGAVLSEIVDNVMPDPDKLEQERWSGEVNECLGGLHSRVDGIEDQLTGERSVRLEGPAATVLQVMLQHCPDGRRRQFWSWSDMSNDLPDLTEREFKDAAGELEHYGLVEPQRTLNGPLRLRLAPDAYAAADKPVMGWDTREDARRLASLALETEGGVKSNELHDATGWSLRRFNPALAVVLQQLGEERISQTLSSDYIASWFRPNDAERFALKRLIGR